MVSYPVALGSNSSIPQKTPTKEMPLMPERTVLLVDGHGLAFRAFFALPELNAPDGTPTNALLGYANMLPVSYTHLAFNNIS